MLIRHENNERHSYITSSQKGYCRNLKRTSSNLDIKHSIVAGKKTTFQQNSSNIYHHNLMNMLHK